VLQPEDGAEAVLLGHVGYEPVHIDEIRRTAQLPIAEVSSSLAMMELKGLVKQVGSMHYVRVREAVVQHAF
jgi:DNA processing protein